MRTPPRPIHALRWLFQSESYGAQVTLRRHGFLQVYDALPELLGALTAERHRGLGFTLRLRDEAEVDTFPSANGATTPRARELLTVDVSPENDSYEHGEQSTSRLFKLAHRCPPSAGSPHQDFPPHPHTPLPARTQRYLMMAAAHVA